MTLKELLERIKINISTFKIGGTIFTVRSATEEYLDKVVTNWRMYYNVDGDIVLEIED